MNPERKHPPVYIILINGEHFCGVFWPRRAAEEARAKMEAEAAAAGLDYYIEIRPTLLNFIAEGLFQI